MKTDITSAVRVFEEVEGLRKSCETRLSHLQHNKHCLDCSKDWMPKSYEPCPECGCKETRLSGKGEVKKRKCQECAHVWVPSSIGVCTWCGSKNFEPAPKTDN